MEGDPFQAVAQKFPEGAKDAYEYRQGIVRYHIGSGGVRPSKMRGRWVHISLVGSAVRAADGEGIVQ